MICAIQMACPWGRVFGQAKPQSNPKSDKSVGDSLIDLNSSLLVPPYGGQLVDLMVPAEESEELKAHAGRLPWIQISDRSLCDLQLLACGAFSPLTSFSGQQDYERILGEMRLSCGHIFPIPVTFPVNAAPELRLDHDTALRSSKNELLAILTVEEIYERDPAEAGREVFSTEDQLPVIRCRAGYAPSYVFPKPSEG